LTIHREQGLARTPPTGADEEPRRARRTRIASAASAQPPASRETPPLGAPGLSQIIGANLRHLRTKKGLSLERLSKASGVSRAMLGKMELGRSMPTIKVLWKIARALGVPFSALIRDPADVQPTVVRSETASLLTSRDRTFVSHALFRLDAPRVVEFYELRLAPAAVERAVPHPPGTKETLVVADGSLGVVVAGKRHHLGRGDAISFAADVPHEYWNESMTALRMFLVMTYDHPR
jgi:transcriptional regulator with XRE-family HTH domain